MFFGHAGWSQKGSDFPMLQSVWPDKAGHSPWETAHDSQLVNAQPVVATKSAWPFVDAKNTTVITTRQVIEEDHLILAVPHDEDGEWQFMCGTTDSQNASGRLAPMIRSPRDCGQIQSPHADLTPLVRCITIGSFVSF